MIAFPYKYFERFLVNSKTFQNQVYFRKILYHFKVQLDPDTSSSIFSVKSPVFH